MSSNPAGSFKIFTFPRHLKHFFGQILLNMEILKLQKYFNYNVLLSKLISTGVPYPLSQFYCRIQIQSQFFQNLFYIYRTRRNTRGHSVKGSNRTCCWKAWWGLEKAWHRVELPWRWHELFWDRKQWTSSLCKKDVDYLAGKYSKDLVNSIYLPFR